MTVTDSRINSVFKGADREGRPVFVSYLTAGYPDANTTIDILLSLQKSGTDVIELGVPFSDPVADGPPAQIAHLAATENGVNLTQCLSIITEARKNGLEIPVVFKCYYNSILQYGEQKLASDSASAGIDGFMVVDLPPEEAVLFRKVLIEHGISYIPIITPVTSSARVSSLAKIADSFLYVFSRPSPNAKTFDDAMEELKGLVERIRKYSDVPLAVAFNVSTEEEFAKVGNIVSGVVVESLVLESIAKSMENKQKINIFDICNQICGRKSGNYKRSTSLAKSLWIESSENTTDLDSKSTANQWFGEFGGQYIPEAVYAAMAELEEAYDEIKDDPKFWEEFKSFYPYIGRPSSFHFASRLTEYAKGAQIYLKREDLNHTGAHKINNTIGQALIAKRLGKTRIVAETGAGQHGVATATVCAKLGLECVIYMGAVDCRRQALNVFRMRILGAKVIPATSGSQTLKDAVNEAMVDWVTNITTTHFLVGSAIGPHPYPRIVRDFQSVISKEAKAQMMELTGKLPDAVIACIGGGSNAIGMFADFIDEPSVRLIGAEGEGDGISTGKHSATMTAGSVGVFQGSKVYLLQDKDGQIMETHSISAGLDYPGVGPEHCNLRDIKRAEYYSVTDKEALQGFKIMSQLEGIIPALESSHAIYKALEIAKTMDPSQSLIICVSGRGDKDVNTVAEVLPTLGPQIGWDLRFEADITKSTQ
ncbi:hypothetical protein BB558_003711 [Smittium angustum]|uniref:Tryptophan synthase n=1 Tax=Smittium angustum TaxID=133377 RepID=A0A2U1IXV2_SMIAN|nr:hypothetical protein BB558_006393 [Smittium angustum]PWA00257.1 hypothetical protein BB558_003711 [Smittium angustum]